jgi:hypothetical protein
MEYVKIVVIDNCSNDGTYPKLLYMAAQYECLSVFRMDKKTKPLYQIEKANELIHLLEKVFYRFVYSFIIYAGEVLSKNYILRCIDILSKNTPACNIIFTPVGNSEDCIANIEKGEYHIVTEKEMLKEYLDQNLRGFYFGHIHQFLKIKGLSSVLLHHDLHSDNTREGRAVVLNEYLSYCIRGNIRSFNKRDDLFQKFYYIKSEFMLFPHEKPSGIFVNKKYYSMETRRKVYDNLSNLAVRYANELYAEEKPREAEECLLFAEMVNLFKDG